MDSKLPRPSGIPRSNSGLPRPTSIPRSSALPTPNAKQSIPKRAPSSEAKPSASSLRPAAIPRAASSLGIPVRPAAKKGDDVFKKPIGRPASRQARSRIQRPAVSAIKTNTEDAEDRLGDLDGFRTSSRLSHRDVQSGEFDFGFDEAQEPQAQDDLSPDRRETSLTERTLESLSAIMAQQAPGSPTSQHSSWGAPTSPMGPPARPGSSMSYRSSRPASRTAGAYRSSSQRPTTPTLRPPSQMSRASSATRSSGYGQTAGKRSASAAPMSPAASSAAGDSESDANIMSPVGLKSPTGFKSPTGLKSPVGLKSPARILSPTGRVSKTPSESSQTMIRRVPKMRPTATSTFDNNPLSPTEESESRFGRPLPSKLAAPAKKAAATEAPDSPRNAPSSSSALREQIAKAKAARKAPKPATPVTNNGPSGGYEYDAYEDPFNQLPKGCDAVINKRVNTARADGRLNIAAMGLTEIPPQVMMMYEYNPDAGASWSETVDLVRFNAADNEIENLGDDVFPDIDPEEAAEDMDAEGPQFGGLEMLDLHGNVLQGLPIGLRRLERLTVLNLSRNRLHNDSFEIISQIKLLRELRLAENEFEGDLPDSIGSLTSLEVLELQNNKISRLPDAMRELVHLRTLNVSTNRLSSLSMEVLQAVPLVDLSAAKNALRGSLFPNTVSGMPRLQILDVSGNALSSLGAPTLSMPALKSLNISINRIDTLPDLTEWSGLLTLLAEENKLSEFPKGFTSLKSLKQANFNGNDIRKLDPQIGLMESLDMLTLAANPLGERKFLTMNTEDLKNDLKKRYNPAGGDDDGAAKGNDADGGAGAVIPMDPMWKLKAGGVLDLSNKDFTYLYEKEFSQVSDACRQLVLHHNNFTYIPDAVALARNITLLDLSNNRLTTTFTDEVSLPHLRDLRFAANKLPSLDFLLNNLSAPHLASLDITANRLSGPLPVLRQYFPELTTLLAADNGIEVLSAQALAGLTTVSLANNSIGRLPPEIGLLWHRGLRQLELEGNTFRVPTYATLQRGTEAVMSWLRDKVPAGEVVGLARELGVEGVVEEEEDETF